VPAGLAAGPAIDVIPVGGPGPGRMAVPVVVRMVDVIPVGGPGPGRMAVPVVVRMVDVIPAGDPAAGLTAGPAIGATLVAGPAAGPTTAPTWIGDVGGLTLQVPLPGVEWRGVEPVASDGRSTRIAPSGLR
jgi:hypothetical protein